MECNQGLCLPLMEVGIDPEVWPIGGKVGRAKNAQLVEIIHTHTHMYIYCFLGPHPGHMESPRLRVESELELQAYTIARETADLNRVFDLHHSSKQCQILHPLSEGRD